jgi:hypothetical protein
MEKDKKITKVIFREFYGRRGTGTIAIFPENSGSSERFCLSYEHVGQHGDCEPVWIIDITHPSKLDQYKDLYEELQSLGYNLKVCNRYTHAMAQKRWNVQ